MTQTAGEHARETRPPNPPGFWRQGEPLVWFSGAALTITLMAVASLIAVVMVKGLGFFWPAQVAQVELADGETVIGEERREEVSTQTGDDRIQFKIGNRDLYGLDFRWIDANEIVETGFPDEIVVVERRENGNFYGRIGAVSSEGLTGATPDTWDQLQAARAALEPQVERREQLVDELSALSDQMESNRLDLQKLQYRGAGPDDPRVVELTQRQAELQGRFEEIDKQSAEQMTQLRRHSLTMVDAKGTSKEIPLIDVYRVYRPNQMSLISKAGFYGAKVVELLSDKPREANTEGGLAPAIFGTVLMVLLMSLFCIPMGVIAAIYLREYAREGLLVRLVRIAVGNLAGVPSIVYGVFGLGFFIYGLGASIDRMFFPERLPTPTFGTGGLLWASLTLSLLTVPVVIVATEEALAAVPRGIREGSLALGATKFQTLVRILMPMASPGIMTGLILAMARAAGEVAPLMLVGVVKLAPAMPLDSSPPFLHFDRKFMHLGFHIYDVGFQSPNVEAAKPMVYVTTLLLVGIVILMSASAIHLRNKMRKRFTTGVF